MGALHILGDFPDIHRLRVHGQLAQVQPGELQQVGHQVLQPIAGERHQLHGTGMARRVVGQSFLQRAGHGAQRGDRPAQLVRHIRQQLLAPHGVLLQRVQLRGHALRHIVHGGRDFGKFVGAGYRHAIAEIPAMERPRAGSEHGERPGEETTQPGADEKGEQQGNDRTQQRGDFFRGMMRHRHVRVRGCRCPWLVVGMGRLMAAERSDEKLQVAGDRREVSDGLGMLRLHGAAKGLHVPAHQVVGDGRADEIAGEERQQDRQRELGFHANRTFRDERHSRLLAPW